MVTDACSQRLSRGSRNLESIEQERFTESVGGWWSDTGRVETSVGSLRVERCRRAPVSRPGDDVEVRFLRFE